MVRIRLGDIYSKLQGEILRFQADIKILNALNSWLELEIINQIDE